MINAQVCCFLCTFLSDISCFMLQDIPVVDNCVKWIVNFSEVFFQNLSTLCNTCPCLRFNSTLKTQKSIFCDLFIYITFRRENFRNSTLATITKLHLPSPLDEILNIGQNMKTFISYKVWTWYAPSIQSYQPKGVPY